VDPKTARNVAIILVLAAAVAFLPGGGTASSVVLQILSIFFLAGIALFAFTMYRERRMDLYGLGDRNRAILYASVGLAVLAVAGTDKLWNTGGGTALWFLMVLAAAGGVFVVYRAAREY
jgi:hypothetical protein